MNKKIYSEMSKLSLDELYRLADLINVGINFNEDESNIEDIKGEIILMLSTESENKINQALEKVKHY
ncbi:hypothetical protein HYT25_03650 [Candidatus Pacearchaeota archaeon]|nr:hypothetical protein [Candidatus Pacearchaeota archaeon]